MRRGTPGFGKMLYVSVALCVSGGVAAEREGKKGREGIASDVL